MKIKRQIFLSLIMILPLLFGGCYTDMEDFNPYDNNFLVSPTLFGFRDSETSLNIPEVNISMNDQNVMTDDFGTIYFNTARVHRDSGSVATCDRDGYFPHYTFLSLAGKTRTIEKVYMVKDNWQTISGIDREREYAEDDYSLYIPAGTFTSEDNTYQLNTHFNTLSDKDFFTKYSGSNQGVRLNNSRVSILPIASFMIEGSTQFANKNMEFKGTISNDILDHITNQLLLWKLNTRTGIYEEVGITELEKPKVIAEISENGLYLIGIAYPFVTINGNVSFQSQDRLYPIQDLKLQLRLNDYLYLEAYTRNDGSYTFFAPQNIDLDLSLLNHCDDLLYEVEVPKLATDRALNPIVIEEGLSLLTASFQNCEGRTNDDVRVSHSTKESWKLLATDRNGTLYSVVDDCLPIPTSLFMYDDGRQNVDFTTFQALDNSVYDLRNISTCTPHPFILSSPYEKVILDQVKDLKIDHLDDIVSFSGKLGETEIDISFDTSMQKLISCILNPVNGASEDVAENEHFALYYKTSLTIEARNGDGYVYIRLNHEDL